MNDARFLWSDFDQKKKDAKKCVFLEKKKRDMCEMRISEKFYIYRQRERHENTF